ncbi:MAG: hypothetical protein PWP20_1533, partial [Eubacteriaceae bacterium]|nr:hypothetical protein [Eubacteriaceae bacterium]
VFDIKYSDFYAVNEKNGSFEVAI